MKADAPIVVVKVGGSLLDWPPLPARLAAYLDARSDVRIVLIAGGGGMADVLRDLDRLHGLGEPTSHALALRVLDVTAHLLAALLAGSSVVDTLADLRAAWSAGSLPILAPRLMLDSDDALPHAWSVTTDSISARVAALLGASELVLHKSAPIPPDLTPTSAAALGLVDPAFLRVASSSYIVTFINLRY